MMYSRKKSDPAIVAKKPTNKAGRPAAEPAERSVGAKGNAAQQSTRRAQDRESVSQALDRIRQAARQRKKEKFTALYHHLSIPMLTMPGCSTSSSTLMSVDSRFATAAPAEPAPTTM